MRIKGWRMNKKPTNQLKQKNNHLVINSRPLLFFEIGLAMIFAIGLIPPSFAQASGYYETPDVGRPRAAYSICCCKKLNEDNSQAFYSCNFVESDTCPQDTKQYKVNNYECPSNLIFTKYSQQ